MLFLYVAPIGAKNIACFFSINITLLRSLKVLILLGFMKKPTLIRDQGGKTLICYVKNCQTLIESGYYRFYICKPA
jgi:hypothetical protein